MNICLVCKVKSRWLIFHHLSYKWVKCKAKKYIDTIMAHFKVKKDKCCLCNMTFQTYEHNNLTKYNKTNNIL